MAAGSLGDRQWQTLRRAALGRSISISVQDGGGTAAEEYATAVVGAKGERLFSSTECLLADLIVSVDRLYSAFVQSGIVEEVDAKDML